MIGRWIALAVLGMISLGPSLFLLPKNKSAETGFSSGFSAPLPPQILEAKAKVNFFGLSLTAIALAALLRLRFNPSWNRIFLFKNRPRSKKLYLIYARLQTDGG